MTLRRQSERPLRGIGANSPYRTPALRPTRAKSPQRQPISTHPLFHLSPQGKELWHQWTGNHCWFAVGSPEQPTWRRQHQSQCSSQGTAAAAAAQQRQQPKWWPDMRGWISCSSCFQQLCYLNLVVSH